MFQKEISGQSQSVFRKVLNSFLEKFNLKIYGSDQKRSDGAIFSLFLGIVFSNFQNYNLVGGMRAKEMAGRWPVISFADV
jgi:hypothetical protein